MANYKLKDILKIKNGRDHQDLLDGKYPVYGSGGIMRYVNQYLYDKPSILLPRKGTLYNIQYCDTPFWTVDTTYYTEIDQDRVNAYFLYRYLRLLDLSNLNTGTGVPSMTFDSYYDVKVNLPDLPTQDAIASVLSSLDRKISLNRKANDVLESMAKQLYDYWFVQFDFPNAEGKPYKSSGGKMVYNETLKREIPEGWEVKNLPHIAKFENGIACQRYRPKDGEKTLRVIKINEMHNGFSESTELVGEHVPESIKISDGDVIFSWSASLEVMVWNQGEGALNQHIFKVTPNNNFPLYYIFYQLHNYVSVFRAMADARKTTMGHITQDHLNQSTIVVPQNMKICIRFEAKILPIFEKIKSNTQETLRLTSLRNYLLPLLMNGQVKVS